MQLSLILLGFLTLGHWSCSTLQKTLTLDFIHAGVRVSSAIIRSCTVKDDLSFPNCLANWRSLFPDALNCACERFSLSEREKRLLIEELEESFSELIRQELQREERHKKMIGE